MGRRMAAASAVLIGVLLAGCGSRAALASLQRDAARETAEKQEALVVYGITDSWSAWAAIQQGFAAKYGIRVDLQHKDWGSRQIIEGFKAEDGPQADVGLVESSFARWGAQEGVLLSYAPTRWDEIPSNRRDRSGYGWSAAFAGTIAFVVNTDKTGFQPRGFRELTDPRLRGLVAILDPLNHGQGSGAVLAAAYATDTGGERNIAPGVDLWRQVAAAGNLRVVEALSPEDLTSGRVGVGVLWDFNALTWQEALQAPQLRVYLPEDGTASLDYAVVINRAAPHPNAARLFVEYVLSGDGQTLLADGHAVPVLTDDAILASAQKDFKAPHDRLTLATRPSSLNAWYLDTTAILPDLWSQQVLPLLPSGG